MPVPVCVRVCVRSFVCVCVRLYAFLSVSLSRPLSLSLYLAVLLLSLVVARLRVEAVQKELKQQSEQLAEATQDNDSLKVQIDVLGT